MEFDIFKYFSKYIVEFYQKTFGKIVHLMNTQIS